jgi:hypothetical protein
VLDDEGRTTHLLQPTDKSLAMIPKKLNSVINIKTTTINCKSKSSRQIYVGADGTVSPCCWIDMLWAIPNMPKRVDYMDKIGIFPNLNSQSLLEIFSSGYFAQIENTWSTDPLMECSRECGKFDKLGAQFEN